MNRDIATRGTTATRDRHGLQLVPELTPEEKLSPGARELMEHLGDLHPDAFEQGLEIIKYYMGRNEVSEDDVRTWLEEIRQLKQSVS